MERGPKSWLITTLPLGLPEVPVRWMMHGYVPFSQPLGDGVMCGNAQLRCFTLP